MAETYLSSASLSNRYGVSRQTIWRWQRDDQSFPKSVALSQGCTRWRLSEIENWEAARAEAV